MLPNSFSSRKELVELIKERIQNNSPITFAEYMDLSLYHPTYGYYHNGTIKIGEHGDFITAPEESPLYAQCIANYLQEKIPNLSSYCILELGAGSGSLASYLIPHLNMGKYQILELSAEHISSQKLQLAEFDNVEWLTSLPNDNLPRIILANEVVDAMPVERWRHSVCWEQAYIDVENETLSLHWKKEEPTCILRDYLKDWPNDREYLYNPHLQGWLGALAKCAQHLLIFDYGMTLKELALTSTSGIRCYQKHHIHHDPLNATGNCDITCDIDFSALLDHPHWQMQNFQNQREFLLENGLATINLTQMSEIDRLKTAQSIKRLVMPDQMGEIFKMLHLVTNRPQ